eukprot:TRINITY_DN820_c0_g4_i2.p1 TRINITY_DN820_c0_g4~~TRINITY_DN820_c0_g4_i2.p1  ORF type:complete len:246 (+),score=87.18 TRINITY_DN820_c0_g4_i2:166-903(+)
MAKNYIAQYEEEVSESSIVNEESEIKEVLKASERPVDRPIENHQRDKFAPYTFDPRSVLKDTQPRAESNFVSSRPYAPTAAGEAKYSAASLNPKPYGKFGSGGYGSGVQVDMSFLTTLGENINECRKTDEFKGFAKEFEKQFENNQREMEQVTKDLNTRTAKLDNFIRDLQNADLDMILFRNRLVREIQDVQNDLKEAFNNILMLMADRSAMRDQFCIFKMKIKKLKGFVKTFQDDIQAYTSIFK